MNQGGGIEVLVERDPLSPVEQSDGEMEQDWVRTGRGGRLTCIFKLAWQTCFINLPLRWPS